MSWGGLTEDLRYLQNLFKLNFTSLFVTIFYRTEYAMQIHFVTHQLCILHRHFEVDSIIIRKNLLYPASIRATKLLLSSLFGNLIPFFISLFGDLFLRSLVEHSLPFSKAIATSTQDAPYCSASVESSHVGHKD